MMPTTPNQNLTRRTMVAAGGAMAGGFLVCRTGSGLAQEATPGAALASPVADITPLGFVTMRMRPLDDPAYRDDMNEQVIQQFLPEIAKVDGFLGYLVADVIDDPALTFGVTVLRDREAAEASDEVARQFVFQDHIDEHILIEETRRWTGDLLMYARSPEAAASPATPPLEAFGEGHYVAARIFQSIPGTDPRGFVPEAQAGFLPIIMALPGFVGYLWFPTDEGFVGISLYDSEASALESTAAAEAWAVEHLAAYTNTPPEVINATVVYANLPIFA
jgi:hypothetical protein